jgi:putative transposase
VQFNVPIVIAITANNARFFIRLPTYGAVGYEVTTPVQLLETTSPLVLSHPPLSVDLSPDLSPSNRPKQNTILEGKGSMSRSNHTEAQMIEALKQVEAGRTAEEVARQYGVSKHTIYAWKAKYGGMDVSEAQEVKQLREENARLKRLVADLTLDKDALQSVIRKNCLSS